MFPFKSTPLAWKNLTHDLRRLLVALSGVTFAVVLMFMERGFQNALFDSTVALVKNFDADIVVSSRARYSLSSSSRFPTSTLSLARGCPGVAAVHPVYIESHLAILRKPNHHGRPIRVVGFDVRSDLFTAPLEPVLRRYRHLLLQPRTAIIDAKSKESIYGVDPSVPRPSRPLRLSLANQSLLIPGSFELGTDFANDGTLFMSEDNFSEFFSFRGYPASPLSTADLGLVTCDERANVDQVRRVLQHELGSGVHVRTREEFIRAEISVWDSNTPIGAIFKVGVVMGFIVGVLICYQVLFNDISDHISEFATLMAMGYSPRYFVSLVVREAVYLAFLGFAPGLGISCGLFQAISSATGLTMTLPMFEIGLVLTFTVAMCIISGLLAARKLLAADPASLF